MLPFRASANDACRFGSTATKSNSYLTQIGLKPAGSNTTQPNDLGDPQQYPMTQIASYLRNNSNSLNGSQSQKFLAFLYNDSQNIDGGNPNQPNFTGKYSYGDAPAQYFTVRTCNSYFNPQVPIRATNVDPFYLGLSSQRTEREDFIITPDLRGNVK